MSQTRFPSAHIPLRCRVATALSLSIALFAECGCATARPAIKSIWNQVPPVRWAGKGRDPNATTAQAERSAEPAMAANVALKTEQASDADPLITTAPTAPAATRSNSALSRLGTRFNRTEPQSRDSTANSEVPDAEDAESEGLVEAKPTDSSMERLNAALTGDISQPNSLPQRSVTSLDARIRVDSLLDRAKQLLDIGQLEQARQTAQTAQELVEASQIDFFPDEDRPIDLIRRIDEVLKESRVEYEPLSEGDSAKSPAAPVGPKTAQPVTTSSKTPNPQEKDASGLARIRRDWSTLFRLDRKPAGSDANPVSSETKLAKLESLTGSLNADVQARHTSLSDSSQAIVMANRSVSLAESELSATASTQFTPNVADQLDSDPDAVESVIRTSEDTEFPDATHPVESATAIIGSQSGSGLESNDGVSIQPDVEVVDAIAPFRQVKSKNDSARTEAIDDVEARQSDWIYLYVIFGICSLLAFGCYRRGAT